MYGEIRSILADWYRENRRELPWRNTSDPYRIWLSEVILQQTRVAQGLGYYERFTERFPCVTDLAAAGEDEVLKLWQGLGYYSRARNLHRAAREVATRFGGKFPSAYEEIRSLRGVGEYTAAAIASFAFGLPYAAVDGNVFRVTARLFDIARPAASAAGKQAAEELAGQLLDPQRPGLHNQAMMEFGALQCTPRAPRCETCPLQAHCLAYARGTVGQRPARGRETPLRNRYFHYLDIRCGDLTLLGQRTAKDIWQGLYEFPLIETDTPAGFGELCGTERFAQLTREAGTVALRRTIPIPRHQLSHQSIHAIFYELEVETITPAMQAAYRIIAESEVGNYAVSRLTERYLEKVSR